MRQLADDMDPTVVADIDRRLAGICEQHQVVVPWAIESGSRAWGFPSPDSDYDCRFFFVRSLVAYADPWPPRDVIETPLDHLLDVNGWDVRKAVRLVVGGNATVAEWLRSPLVYSGEPDFRDELLAVVDGVADLERIRRHYLHVGLDQWERSGARSGGPIKLKRAFYAIRPAAALQWMERHRSPSPPMNLRQLLDEAPPAEEAVVSAIDDLVALKATSREMGEGRVPAPVVDWVNTVFARQAEGAPVAASAHRLEEARERFYAIVERWGPVSPSGG